MILMQLQQVARHFGADVLFDKVNLDIKDDSRIALVGRNGAGKSTLLKMIVGESEPDEGQIIRKKGLTIGYLSQDTNLQSDKTIYAEMLSVFTYLQEMEQQLHHYEQQIADPNADHTSAAYEQLLKNYDQLQHDFKEKNGYSYENEIRSVLHGFNFFEADFDTEIASLSGGQKTRLALAKLLLEKRDLLILDEPTNHLDIATLAWLENYIQGYQGALLIVSHDRYFLDKIVKDVYELAHHTSHHYPGNYSQFIKNKAARQQQAWKEYEKQQAEIKKLEEFVDKNIVRASTTKRAQSRRKQLEKIERIERPENDKRGPRFEFTAAKPSGNIVLTIDNAAVGYEDTILSAPINLDLRKNKVVAIVGPNGIGKSTLLKSVLNLIPFLQGSATLGTNVTVGYYDQEQQGLHPEKTVLAEVWDEHPLTAEKDIRSILGSFLFTGDDVNKLVHDLSGGEKARLTLTKLALQHDNFLVFDEPTNHLDIESKEVLEQAIANFDGTVLFVSHDRYFINKVATEVMDLTPEGNVIYLGDYDYYLAKKAELAALAEQAAKENGAIPETVDNVSQGKLSYQQSKEQQKQERKLQREVTRLEELVMDLDSQKESIEQQMAQPEVATNLGKLSELQKELDQVSEKLADVEGEWTLASLALEEFLDA
ncbi:ABC-F family ATP-binding cassette domain-containing protein [Ligilactobacillus ceti]|uniref:ABC superfamily ATP binding cassette transporter, ABC protein n=1 Tax=Ligilactobacillus ceti DSM 22408 TaxID=1122146 RepID=A0A0R2KGA8_9LACO|nr:ABC-F family ATP-binding cassette domain-containing protein [Ligilactobacillus ceti]KRN88425.1 ABC superfamily ATP binding cassette transporter, ABC protein [Ligilactobacillus ceti DSM 22408]